jgi:CRP-like cAMP-binding protein
MGKPSGSEAIIQWPSILHHGGLESREVEHVEAQTGDEPVSVLARWIRRCGVARELRADVTLFEQGHACRDLYWIERGWVTLLRSEGTGSDIIIGFRTEGALLGAGALIPHAVHPLTACTRTPVRVWSIAPDALNDALDSDPTLRRAVFECIAVEASEQAARCGALGCLDAREHLERLLMQFVTRRAGIGPARIPLTTGEIAGLLGIDLSHACRLLRTMRREGLIEVSRGWIVIPDPSRLDTRRAS